MLLHIPDILSADQVADFRRRLDAADWTDGRETVGHLGAQAKHNQQLPEASPLRRELGEIMYRGVGVERTSEGLRTAIEEIRDLRRRFWRNVRVPGTGAHLNQALERAGRIADFLELAEVMAVDALDRQESCGAHFRSEVQDAGEAKRDDDRWAFASASPS